MLSQKYISRLSLLFSIASWLALLVIDMIIILGTVNRIPSQISPEIPGFMLALFFFTLFVYFRFKIGKAESINFIDLLWRVFAGGLLTTLVSFLILFIFFSLRGKSLISNPFFVNFLYHINLGAISAFLISTFTYWKRLILYQKSKKLLKFWKFFEYLLLLSIVYSVIPNTYGTVGFNIIMATLFLMGAVLSVNLKWIAYLNFKQKWKSILLLLLVALYLWHFLTTLFEASESFFLVTDLSQNAFILALFAFIFLYAVFSLLVLLFNLPTSSVFERKLEEIVSFQRLSQSIQTEKKEERVYDILLESAVSAVMADAAWLEINRVNGSQPLILQSNIDEEMIGRLKSKAQKGKIRELLDGSLEKLRPNIQKYQVRLDSTPYRSVLVVPLLIKEEEIGRMILLKEVDDGFNREMTTIIKSFANQACISLENFRLIQEALENERYKEELKIAQEVQKSLLPKELKHNDKFDISAFSQSAAEVGGDYYDTYQIDADNFALIIGDVSGKGTSAAFHMSQMKGIFHSLVQLNLNSHDFLLYANQALSRFLDRTSFITVSFFLLNTKDKSIEYVRAGHCPTLYYKSKSKESYYLESKGLGLGIIRNSTYNNYVEVNRFTYEDEDIMVLYSDGIIEARNKKGEEFGYKRLENFLKSHAELSVADLEKALIDELYRFCEKEMLDDDYTTMIIRFKNSKKGNN
ncbi:PP2C family protein-serine/threonine phosphatase [Xanthovirga aplysinae]|uniref:PP2C family protein-serine/threonine phosphatase n=1 Tax=Xanthovirga aplysinae TaxID=2529853 RepID=UPI0012BD5ECF|nr:GAF domain-containing SpoIIE family protein phosphatase [Xanthovirga aplysinae]MTI32546.1 serine/threonine protein phosphatase [Xanthovirga aplysinae]